MALAQAKELFGRLSTISDELKRARSHQQTVMFWIEFIHNAQRMINKLGAGSKGFSPSENWFRELLKQREQDPLLNYIFQARNADEHGIQEAAAHAPAETFSLGNDFLEIEGRRIPIFLAPTTSYLAPVHNRGETYRPPDQDGPGRVGLDPRQPAVAANAAMGIYTRWIAEASQFPLREEGIGPP
jgi:hypothetical protein